MTHQVLARKWRPRIFADVVGQEHVVQALANALDSGRIHHAYLFTGTRGVGKTTLARILAKALNCQGPDGNGGITSQPCGVCRACTDIDAGRFVDLLEVDAATNTKVDEMRELLETAQYMPVSGRYKVYIIDEVHMLSKSAFNAMLKTLEEPPGHVEFILATTDPQKLPITVLSRCLQFNLKNLPPLLIASHLKRVLEAEQVPYEMAALDMLGRAAEGSVRDSLSLLDQAIAYGAGKVTHVQVADMLGALDQTYLYTLLNCVAAGNAMELMTEIERLGMRSISFDLTLKDFSSLLYRIALIQSAGSDALGASEGDIASLIALAVRLSHDDVQLFYQIALLGRRDLALAPDEQTGFTMTLLRMLAFGKAGAGQKQIDIPSIPSSPASHGQPESRAAKADSGKDGASKPVAPKEFDGNWPEFVSHLNLAGLAGMLARHCELIRFANGVFDLRVPDQHKHLAEKNYQEKLRAELAAHFGAAVRLNIQIGAANGSSLVAKQDREAAKRQAEAEVAIDNDPFIRNLVQDFGAEVVRSTIRPVP